MKSKLTDEAKFKKIDDFNAFACTHKFYSVKTGLVDQPYLIDIGGQMVVNPKCEARYDQLVQAWNRHQKNNS